MGFSRQEYWSGCHCLLRWRQADGCSPDGGGEGRGAEGTRREEGERRGRKRHQKVRDHLEQGDGGRSAGDGARTQPDKSDTKTCKVEQKRPGHRPSPECPCPLLSSLLLKGSTCFSHLEKGTSPGQVTLVHPSLQLPWASHVHALSEKREEGHTAQWCVRSRLSTGVCTWQRKPWVMGRKPGA